MKKTSCDSSGREICLAQTLNMKATGSFKTTVTINRHGVMSQKTHVFIIKSCLKPTQSQNSFTPKFFKSMNNNLSHIFRKKIPSCFNSNLAQEIIKLFFSKI